MSLPTPCTPTKDLARRANDGRSFGIECSRSNRSRCAATISRSFSSSRSKECLAGYGEKAEDEEALIVRLYEYHNQTTACQLRCQKESKSGFNESFGRNRR